MSKQCRPRPEDAEHRLSSSQNCFTLLQQFLDTSTGSKRGCSNFMTSMVRNSRFSVIRLNMVQFSQDTSYLIWLQIIISDHILKLKAKLWHHGYEMSRQQIESYFIFP